MKNIQKVIIAFGAVVALFSIIHWIGTTLPVRGAAQDGDYTQRGTTSVVTLDQAADYTIYATSTDGCTARVITTRARPIIIRFGDKITATSSGVGAPDFTPDSNTGHVQAASTTITYDTGLYGCGRWTARNHGDTAANATAIVSEFFGSK